MPVLGDLNPSPLCLVLSLSAPHHHLARQGDSPESGERVGRRPEGSLLPIGCFCLEWFRSCRCCHPGDPKKGIRRGNHRYWGTQQPIGGTRAAEELSDDCKWRF